LTKRCLLLVLLAACGKETARKADGTPAPPSPDAWWTAATTRAAGGEKPLAPRELRALLEEGKRLGFDRDEAWWAERRKFAHERILEVDPLDPEANEAAGRKVLQEFPDFAKLWEGISGCRAPNEAVDFLLGEYDARVQAGERIFLTDEEWNVAGARLKEAREHVRRLEEDPAYAGLQLALGRVRGTPLGDYPHVHLSIGPFLVFYAARDLQRISTDKPEEDEARVAGRREVYRKWLEEKRPLYEALLEDMRATLPELFRAKPISERDPILQWFFSERALYEDYLERTHQKAEGDPGIAGHLDSMGRAFLYELPEETEPAAETPHHPTVPAEARPSDPLGESALRLAAQQILRRFGAADREVVPNRFVHARSLWLKEGLPAWFAARRVKVPRIGRDVIRARRFQHVFPPISRVVERESWLELAHYQEPVERDPDQREVLLVVRAFPDLAWALVDLLLSEEPRREAFRKFVQGTLDGGMRELREFEQCFGIEGTQGWESLDRAIANRLDAVAKKE